MQRVNGAKLGVRAVGMVATRSAHRVGNLSVVLGCAPEVQVVWRTGLVVAARAARLVLSLQPVAGFPHGENVAGLRRIVLELASELSDVRVDRATHDDRAVSPHFPHELLT